MAAHILPPAGAMPATSLPPEQVAKAAQAAQDFEAMALGQMLAPMFETVDTAHGPFGGGAGEEAFKPMLVSEMAKQIASHGASVSPPRSSPRCCALRRRASAQAR
jgi:peptidoglycan hydrolase FlgJ